MTDQANNAHSFARDVYTAAPRAMPLALRLLGFGPVIILLALIVIAGAIIPIFLSLINIANILAQTAVIAVVPIGQHLVILTRGIDLSAGSNLALATVVGGLVSKLCDSSLIVDLAILVTATLVRLSLPKTTWTNSTQSRTWLRRLLQLFGLRTLFLSTVPVNAFNGGLSRGKNRSTGMQ